MPPAPAVPPPWRHDRLALGPDLGVMTRAASGTGVSYAAGVAYGAHLNVPFLRWLSMSLYYLHADQSMSIDGPAAWGTAAELSVSDSLSSYLLGARLQPTLPIGERAAAWLNVGAAWGVLSFPVVRAAAADPYVIRTPPHSFIEFPLGIGGEWELVPRWLALQANAEFAIAVDDAASPVQSVTQSGLLAYSRALPGFTHSFVSTIGLALKL